MCYIQTLPYRFLIMYLKFGNTDIICNVGHYTERRDSAVSSLSFTWEVYVQILAQRLAALTLFVLLSFFVQSPRYYLKFGHYHFLPCPVILDILNWTNVTPFHVRSSRIS